MPSLFCLVAGSPSLDCSAPGIIFGIMKRTRIEVTPAENGWTVIREGFGRDSTHQTKDAATQRAVKLARQKQPSELVIYRVDGSVQDTRVYGGNIGRILKH